MKVSELFYSIQGETTLVGEPTYFIRLYGCNLRCNWCDTKYSYEKNSYIEYSVEQIYNLVKKENPTNICITGGEPLLQYEEVISVIDLFVNDNSVKTISIETNGSIDISKITERYNTSKLKIVMDYKLEGSYEINNMNTNNFKFLRDTDEIKFVISDYNDLISINKILECYYKKGKILIGFVAGTIQPKEIAKYILKNKLDWRINYQLHKLIWSSEERGV
ncbi:7-carboxy-7-deazaguanine synthase QueE [Paramaledivibacter caminithermalis]|jgi:7-carboxy-7-deazaguanine synthase|uniref:7-carboxy-7-deazaguanine synthase n=1 Tax=Paramaledivibacter caminithermalis (strain DSM 15212 / CIP 107654 / DViRD3) TaxID=1121301 RepID=A0A1M6QZX7_PARC5|nr:radical SAM protein [Paramaledivibacter caminithermalis]SHK25627.1 7-carboxy-7-deazaguanine synthase [Paramaledivibacter caminithermalis DSM 15212]